jgi:hypothetical protein
MTHLYTIRHAQVAGSKPGITGSIVPDSGLAPLGETQAEQLRDRLRATREIQADVMISSLLRPLPIVLDFRYTSITHWYRGYNAGFGEPGVRWHLKRYNDYAHLPDE